MPLLRGGRPLKRWRYVGVYGPELMLCAVEAFVGPFGHRFWGLAEPGGRLLGGRALLGSGRGHRYARRPQARSVRRAGR
jgi:hypothetical protein